MRHPLFHFLLYSGLGCTLASAQNLPTKLLECEGGQCIPGGGGGGSGTWTFDGHEGHAQWPGSGAVANLTIERFDFDGILIRRVDIAGRTPGITAVYTGKVEGNRIEGHVTWSWPGHWNRSPTSTWYAIVQQPANYAFLDPDVPCTQSSASGFGGSGAEAAARAVQAIEAKNQHKALCWLRMGATRGDAAAEGMLAVFLYKGLGIPPDYPQAFTFAKRAANQGNYLGERGLSLMYANGQGVAKDPLQAQFWGRKADKDKSAVLLAEQQTEERQRNQLAQAQQSRHPSQNGQSVGALLMLGLILGAMEDGTTTGQNPHSSVVCPGDPNNHTGLCND